MKNRNRPALIVFFVLIFGLIALARPGPAEAVAVVSRQQQDEVTETPTPNAVTPADIISAVNSSRVAHGLNTLVVHPALMAVAADQASALAYSEGSVGHERPCGMSLGQDLLLRGFPLLGDLSLDGYRSENWVETDTMESAMAFWMSDEAHRDTMLDENRSHIGAAVATSSSGAVFIVLETALSTSSGQMQYDAYPILTGIPQTQSACYGMYTQAATMGVSVNDMLPVLRNTAMPNGDVYHDVKYGQTLWTLAIQYNTTIATIKQLNHLTSDVIAPGQKLLIKTGATQPPPDPRTPSPTPIPTRTFPWVVASPTTPTPTAPPTPTSASVATGEFVQQNGMVIVAIVVSFSVLIAVFAVMGRKKPQQ